jgi:hypothetical protein
MVSPDKCVFIRFRHRRTFLQAPSLGNTRLLKSLYEAASLSFDLSPEHIRDLGAFVQQEIEALWA